MAGCVQPWIVVDPDSGRIPRAPPYSGFCWRRRPSGYAALTLCGPASQRAPLRRRFLRSVRSPTTPLSRFRLLPFRSPLLGESLLISLPALLRWFTSRSTAPAGCLLRPSGCMPLGMRVAPFGDPRIAGCVLLRADYRGLPRPSSPSGPSGIRHGPIIAWPCPSSRAPALGRRARLPSLLPFSLPVKEFRHT